MPWKWAALMPHPPILVPEVGCGRESEAAATLAGMMALTRAIRDMGAVDVVLLLSPHQPYAHDALSVNRARLFRGSFASFGAPHVAFEFAAAADETDALSAYLIHEGPGKFPVRFGAAGDLTRDQGSTVPLYFLRREFGELPPIVFATPIGVEPSSAFELGRRFAWFEDERSWGLLASGDLSHRLKPNAPVGYSPAGQVFDDAVVAALRTNDVSALLDMPVETYEEAGECGFRSALTMLGLVAELDGRQEAIEVLSYEGPFGVGYCNAFWRRRE